MPSSSSARHDHSGHEHAHYASVAAANRAVNIHAAAPAADPSQVEYTCPMHPQVRQMGPGHCPICGMALEPVLATAQAGPATGSNAVCHCSRWTPKPAGN
ncbi:hypothetical protein VAR608DRAFT_2365 [Variovorax sp. HW608]|uniref:heavy metal-binding domain-containing protein n=1 Tax=Variovorax sp. HW608 TaxID=1034889 RepID=UPI00081FE553|nr:heavy metal-binding domain-containing protein [Variovorax sp. HW608]SCK28413.1 hypothetical protein VAR608DRAFT_2365 [Variovorax sp. HW608]